MGSSTRRLALGVLVAMAIALGPATASFAAPTGAPPAVPAISASPDTLLIDGQTITVTGTNYPANNELDLVQCVQDQGCDFSNLLVLESDANGGYTTSFNVHRLMHLDEGVQVDCAVAQNCVLVSLDITDLSTGAQTSIGFDPSVPLPPQLRFRMAPNANNNVRVDKGVARITGSVHCDQPVEIEADLTLVQIWHEQIFTSFALVDIECSRDTHFSAVFRPLNGLFGEGTAKLHIDAFGSNSSSYELVKNVQVNLVAHTS